MALRELLRSGAILSYRIRYDRDMHKKIGSGIEVLNDQLKRARDSGDEARIQTYRERVQKSENALAGASERLALSRRGILDVTYTVTDLYDGEAIEVASVALGRNLAESGMGLLNNDLMIFSRAVTAYEADHGIEAETLIDRIIDAPR